MGFTLVVNHFSWLVGGFYSSFIFCSFKFVFVIGYSSLGQWVIAEAKGWSRAVRLIYHPKVVAVIFFLLFIRFTFTLFNMYFV